MSLIIAPDDKNSTTGGNIARGCYWPPLCGSGMGGYANRGLRPQWTSPPAIIHPHLRRSFWLFHRSVDLHPFRGFYPRLWSFAPTALFPAVSAGRTRGVETLRATSPSRSCDLSSSRSCDAWYGDVARYVSTCLDALPLLFSWGATAFQHYRGFFG